MEEEIRMVKRLLYVCCEEGSMTLLKTTLAKYPYLINEADPRGLTPLAIALKAGQYDVAHYLHSQGADINAVNKVSFPVVHLPGLGAADYPVLGRRKLSLTGSPIPAPTWGQHQPL